VGRVIHTEGAGKDRNRLVKSVVVALRELLRQPDTGPEAHDLVAYIGLALGEVAATIDESVAAWEKRGYWVKADRFRLEWAWTERLSRDLLTALLADDWAAIAPLAVKAAAKLAAVEVAVHHRLGTPWVGAWAKLQAQEPKESR
jgi:hypothetical protein